MIEAIIKYNKKYINIGIELVYCMEKSTMDKKEIGAPIVYKLLYVCSLIFSPKYLPLNAILLENNSSILKIKMAK